MASEVAAALEALHGVFTSSAASQAALGAAAKAFGSAGAQVAQALYGRLRKGTSQASALAAPVTVALVRALAHAREESPLGKDDWWAVAAQEVQQLLHERAVVQALVTAVVTRPGDDHVGEELEQVLVDADVDLERFACACQVNVQEFLQILPATICDELAAAAVQDDSPLRGLWQIAQMQAILTSLDAGRVPPLSRWQLREQLIELLRWVEKDARTSLPGFLPRGLDIAAVTRHARLRGDLRKSPGPVGYNPPAAVDEE